MVQIPVMLLKTKAVQPGWVKHMAPHVILEATGT
jgi:hypothetical protein